MSGLGKGNVTVVPSARRLMSSLRNMGYDTPSAIADLIDNSIDADARSVAIAVADHGADSWIRIADDGLGMTGRELDEAMRYGASRQYGDRDLGHFGLGLKTASLSQCRRLSVASRTTARGRIEIRRWDLDRVAALDAWELERSTPRQSPPWLTEPLGRGPGTVVLWEGLDRVMSLARPDGAVASRAVHQLRDEITRHLSMVFHRFLAGELGRRRRRLRIAVDGTPVVPWDPYARDEPATQRLESQSVRLRHSGRVSRLRVQPYVLPPQIEFSSAEAHAAAAGPLRWNRQQGLYIYRRDRMIQSGGWNRLRTLDEHSKLARIAVDIPPTAEEAFKINVSKMAVGLPAGVRAELAAVASGVVGRAQDAYRQRVRAVVDEVGGRPITNAAGPTDGWQMADHWPLIVEVLERELDGHPELLRGVLLALANSEPSRDEGDSGVPNPGAPLGLAS